MTAPAIDGRSMIERARELVKLDNHAFHERSGEGLAALRMAIAVVEALQEGEPSQMFDALAAMHVKFRTPR